MDFDYVSAQQYHRHAVHGPLKLAHFRGVKLGGMC